VKKGKVSVKGSAAAGKTVTITASYKGKKAKYKLYVSNKKAKVTKFKAIKKTLNIIEGTSEVCPPYSCSRKTSGRIYGYTTSSWKSSNKSVAAIDANGQIVAKKAGKVTLTGKAGGKTVKYTCTVTSATTVLKNSIDRIIP
jgi:alpha-L-fucosidase 2